MKQLIDVCEIHAGYSFRGKVEHVENGGLAVVQMKDLEQDYTKIGDNLTQVATAGIKEKYFLTKGDVLLAAKGANNKAVLFDLDISPVVASSVFFVLRVDKSKLDPAYLFWFLNHSDTQNKIKANLAGTYTLNLSRKSVEDIQIPLPDLNRQKQIAHLAELQQREYWLSRQLMEKKETLLNTLLINSIN